MNKIKDVVSWVMKDDKILKLEKVKKTYDISDEVASYLEKAGLYDKLEDKDVEVEIDETKGQEGTIIRLNIVKDSTKTEDKKDKRPPETEPIDCPSDVSGLVVKEITVGGVSVDKAGVIDNDTKTWYTLDSTINAQKFKDECTKKVVEITIAPQEKGNDVIKSYTLKAEEKKEEPKKESENTFTNGKDSFYRIKQLENQVRYLKEEKSESFEAQASVNSANQAISGMVSIHTDPEKVLRTIEKIATKNFELIQKLKTKKE